ncbi:MAG: family 1 glycosylhydrolase [Anaerolineales bacterium]|nr:family 1 glycosylhydrolase [Anaerolineales bacterium]
MITARYQFPRNFLWGTCTASHQVEGQNHHSDWWHWEQQPDRILHGHRSDDACGWWDGMWAEDMDRARVGSQNAHRLSLEWSRIEPHPAVWDEDAIERYREILQGMLERGIEPMVTLVHFSHPQWFIERGGWLQADSWELFERYVDKCVRRLKDLVTMWVTINEPNVYVYSGFVEGVFPPGMETLGAVPVVTGNLLKAHAAAYRAIHAIQADAMVGIAHHYRSFKPANGKNPLDKFAASFRHRAFNAVFPEALRTGRIQLLHWRESLPELVGTQDFFGLNYYTRETVDVDLMQPDKMLKTGNFPPGADVSPGGFIANEPEGFWEALTWAHDFALPIYITENGVEDPEDNIRSRYLACHLRELWKAANFNWQIKGYYHWTLVDNFEWERGWTQRFGLWDLDPRSKIRTRRPSADFYAEICKTNGLSAGSVAEFAPEVLDRIFPGRGTDALSE